MPAAHQMALILLAVLIFSAVSKRLTRRWLTTPMIFTGLGVVSGTTGFGWLSWDPEAEFIQLVAETTLVLLLFSDASQIRMETLRGHLGIPARLLGIGLPLTIFMGTGAAMLLFPTWSLWEAALVATILAPTDAALGQAVVSNEAVPEHVRQALTVESGLNDGIALPVVLVVLALATAQAESGVEWAKFWVAQVTLGPLIGLLIGSTAGAVLRHADQNGWAEHSFVRIGSLCAAGLCYLVAEAVGGNGFMAAFAGGFSFGTAAPDVSKHVHAFLEVEGQLLMLTVFLLVGCVFAGPAIAVASTPTFVYAILSLTVLRVVPVAMSLLGIGLGGWSSLFIGWFGPRGLASILFGLLLLEDHLLASGEELFGVIVITVLLSILLHGLTAAWGAERYGAWAKTHHQTL